MHKPRHTWDTRAWLLGILGGATGGSLAAWATYAPINNWLNRLPVSLSQTMTANIVSFLSLLFTILVLPGLLSGLARRWTFCWGLLPLSLVFFDVEVWIVKGFKNIVGMAWSDLGIIAICLIVSSGPVSLFRWLRVRAARRHAALLASYRAARETGGPQEGVWPPPPEHRDL